MYLFLEELYFIEDGKKEIFSHVFSFSVGVGLVVTYLTLLDGFLSVAGTSHSESGLLPTTGKPKSKPGSHRSAW